MAKDYVKINSPLDLKYDKGNIVASYKYHHKTFRYNLLKIDKSFFLPSVSGLKFNEFFSEEECTETVKKMEETLGVLNKALIQITKSLKDGESNKTKAVNDKIDELLNVITTPDGLVGDFTSWIEELKKKKYKEDVKKGLKPRKTHPSLKDYISTRNLLTDYEHDELDTPLQLKDIDDDFLSRLIEYCYEERPKTSNEDPPYVYKTMGDLTNKTIKKRMDCLFTFITSKYGSLPNDIKKPEMETCERKIIRLTKEELKQLEELDIDNKRLEIARDYFVFMCLTGLRYGDFSRLNRTYYDSELNEIYIKASKTAAECHIYLFDKAKEIGDKYDYCFNHFSNQKLNKALQDLFKKYDLFGEEITMQYMQRGEQFYTKKKRELLSCHAGRRTHISIMIEQGLEIYYLMSTTGHKKVDTLKYYIDKFGPDRRKRFETINEKLK